MTKKQVNKVVAKAIAKSIKTGYAQGYLASMKIYKKPLNQITVMEEIRLGSVYRHYNGGIYTVTDLVINEETLEPMVVYSGNDKRWVRRRAMFLAVVHFVEDRSVQRFTLIKEADNSMFSSVAQIFEAPVNQNEVNSFLLVNALRYLDNSQLRNLGESILARVPKAPSEILVNPRPITEAICPY